MRQRASVLRVYIALLAAAALASGALAAPSIAETARTRPYDLALLFLVAVVLQLVSLDIGGKASMGVSAVAIVAGVAVLGSGAAIAIGAGAALVQWGRRRGLAYKAVFDVSNFALAAGAAGVVYEALVPRDPAAAVVLAAASVAGAAYAAVNVGLLCLAISLFESRRPSSIWRERFGWAWFALLAFGPLAGIAALNYQHSRLGGVLSLLLLALFLQFGMHDQLEQRLSGSAPDAVSTTRG